MTFKLSQNSLKRLEGVNPRLISVVKRAIEITEIDFGVIEGVRTKKRQAQLVAAGKSQTMNSKHIEGKAVDLVAVVNGKITWDLSYYDNIADAMKQAAKELGIKIRWGAAWTVNDLGNWDGDGQSAMDSYVSTRRKQGRRPFIDGVHFELS